MPTQSQSPWWQEMNIGGMKVTVEELLAQLSQAEKDHDNENVYELLSKLVMHPQLTVHQWSQLSEKIFRGHEGSMLSTLILARDPNGAPEALAARYSITLSEYDLEELKQKQLMFDKMCELNSQAELPIEVSVKAKAHWAKIANIIPITIAKT